MSLAGNASTLAALTRDLALNWERTKEAWQDAKAAEFERRYLADLMAGGDRAAAVFEELDKLITKIRRDCE